MLRLALVLVLVGCSSSTPQRVDDSRSAPEPVAETKQAPAGPTTGLVQTGSLHSESLGVDKDYLVYLPDGYDSGDDRYPVLYLLHGLTGNERSWIDHIALRETADQMGFSAIIVMPDGDDGFYVNWASEADYDACLAGRRPFGTEADMKSYCVERADYEDYITDDLVAHVDATYRTVPAREARAISGVSMGGYGALVVAMRNTEMFGAVGSHSGVDTLLYKGPRPYASGQVELVTDPAEWIAAAGRFGRHFETIFGRDIEYWRNRDPAVLAETLDPEALAIYLDAGSDDQLMLHDGAQYLDEVLTRRGIDHEFSLEPGGHDLTFFRSRIDDGLAFFSSYFTR